MTLSARGQHRVFERSSRSFAAPWRTHAHVKEWQPLRWQLTGWLLLLLAGCAAPAVPTLLPGAGAVAPVRAVYQNVPPPKTARRPFMVTSPNGARSDDYYWLRDDARTSPEVLDVLRSENRYRDAALAHVETLQMQLFTELTTRLQPDDAAVPVSHHGFYYGSRFVPGGEQPVYVRRADAPGAQEQVLLDGNAMAKAYGYFSIGSLAASPDGKWLAYCVDTTGRRQYALHVKNLDTGEVLADTVSNVEADLAWANDNRTLLYVGKDPVTLLSTRVMKHRVGSSSSADTLVYEEADHSYYVTLARSASDEVLFIASDSTLQSEWRYALADDPALLFAPVLPREAGHKYEVNHVDGDFIIRTNWQAEGFRIMRAAVAQSRDKSSWREIVPARPNTLIESFAVYRDYLAVNEWRNGRLSLWLRPWAAGSSNLHDRLLTADEPDYAMSLIATPGSSGSAGRQWLRYTLSSLKTPTTTFDLDLTSGERIERKREAVLGGFDAAHYTTELMYVPVRDGAAVPVSLVRRVETKLDGSAPLLQYGYGSYGLSIEPEFHHDWLSLLDRGFVVAIAHVRGGQEMGRSWYLNGKLFNKLNTFNDFIDVTRYLVHQRYVAADKVFAEGGSAGGLLMGAVANMAPRDYRGIIAHVPFVDVLTTMLDESIPLTTNEFDEWGDPRNAAAYTYMRGYSPYDNVVAQDYPALFVTTGLWDSQVQYFEPAKWVARLRELKTDANPLIFSVDMQAGHGGKAGRYERYQDIARIYAFMLDMLGRAH